MLFSHAKERILSQNINSILCPPRCPLHSNTEISSDWCPRRIRNSFSASVALSPGPQGRQHRPVAREMISSAHKAPPTLCKAAVSSPFSSSSSSTSSFSIASSFLPSLSLVKSSFLSLLLFLSCLFLPLRSLVSSPRRGSGSFKSPSEHIYICILLMLALAVIPIGSFPSRNQDENKGNKNGIMPSNPHASFTVSRTISILTPGDNDKVKNSTSSEIIANSFQGDQPNGKLENSFQRDQPPRRTVSKGRDFHSNLRKTQARTFYLRTANEQYIQIYNGTVSGTLEKQPVLGKFVL